MPAFVYTSQPQRVLFGWGYAQQHLAEEFIRLDAKSIMIVASGRDMVRSRQLTPGPEIRLRWDDIAPHVPRQNVTTATAAAIEHEIDLIVSIGGGSSTGLAKAIALETCTTIIAVPTTYAGSEATPMWGITDSERKSTGTDINVLPATIVYDPKLTLSLPVDTSMVSGLNALAHCVDSMWSPNVNPIADALAAEGIHLLNQALPDIKQSLGKSRSGRESAMLGSYLSATAFSSAGSGLHHKICHLLGGTYGLPHASTHAVVLPYVLALLGPAVPEAETRIAAALKAASALEGLESLRSEIGAPRNLREIGFSKSDIERAANEIACLIPAVTPRPVSVSDLTTLLSHAWSGKPPTAKAFLQ
ncbi:maleylacetate reductase [Rhodococcus sp. 06-235-1A]|uniref:maleylacetate reductase n=1 Tax=Rhodococcus sp. 06-235-1A TaxID=2022508 RepID=UPI000B9ABFB7|nr:maleylacetate reductase [Rhodococcus sp. 06-235-1A]OZD06588.1 maleylacetate reductase [Rhodococcus sp. 06-235-1A]